MIDLTSSIFLIYTYVLISHHTFYYSLLFERRALSVYGARGRGGSCNLDGSGGGGGGR